MNGPSIRFDAVALTLGGVEILRHISFSIAAGEIHCIIGPNGGGKTSLVRCLLGQMPHTGTIAIDWQNGTTTGYVPQLLELDKSLPVTVDDFMAMVCEKRRPAFIGPSKSSRRQSQAALARVGLSGKGKTKLGSLSGGERQRVLFAQALIPEPSLLVLDEPMTSLDEIGIARFAELIGEIASSGTTVVWIAHDLNQVKLLADSASCVNRELLFSGEPAEVLTGRETEALFGHPAAGDSSNTEETA